MQPARAGVLLEQLLVNPEPVTLNSWDRVLEQVCRCCLLQDTFDLELQTTPYFSVLLLLLE